MNGQERRRHARMLVSWHVRLWSEEGLVLGMADDASDHGIRIITAREAAVITGRFYRIDVLAGVGVERSLIGEVRHADDSGRIGFATRSRWQPPLPRSAGDAA